MRVCWILSFGYSLIHPAWSSSFVCVQAARLSTDSSVGVWIRSSQKPLGEPVLRNAIRCPPDRPSFLERFLISFKASIWSFERTRIDLLAKTQGTDVKWSEEEQGSKRFTQTGCKRLFLKINFQKDRRKLLLFWRRA